MTARLCKYFVAVYDSFRVRFIRYAGLTILLLLAVYSMSQLLEWYVQIRPKLIGGFNVVGPYFLLLNDRRILFPADSLGM